MLILDEMFGDAVKIIVEKTNLYAKEMKNKNWEDTTVEDCISGHYDQDEHP